MRKIRNVDFREYESTVAVEYLRDGQESAGSEIISRVDGNGLFFIVNYRLFGQDEDRFQFVFSVVNDERLVGQHDRFGDAANGSVRDGLRGTAAFYFSAGFGSRRLWECDWNNFLDGRKAETVDRSVFDTDWFTIGPHIAIITGHGAIRESPFSSELVVRVVAESV